MFFDIQPEDESIIKVIGVGGGGSNAVNFMYKQGITGVNFIICNTDQQALNVSEVPTKIQLGPSLTGGRGAGAKPEIGKQAAIESEEEIRKALGSNTQMVFVTAGMGGGTGTGGAPEVAKIAKEMGILTVGIVTVPFEFEGRNKRDKAFNGLDRLRDNVDALIVISNNKLREIFGNLSLTVAFSHADNVLTTAARGISEIITKPGLVNVDFEDVKTVMKDSGVAIMGIGVASGEDRASKAIDLALSSPLLNDNDIYGARGILLYISSGAKEVTMDEVSQITDFVQQASSNDTEVIWGVCQDDSLEDELSVTLIATGFNTTTNPRPEKMEKKVVPLDAVEEPVKPVVQAEPTVTFQTETVERIQLEEKPQTIVLDLEVPEVARFTYLEEEKVEETPVVAEEPTFNIREVYPSAAPVARVEEPTPSASRNDRADTAREIMRRRLSASKLSDHNYISELDRIPSFERKNKKFDSIPHSSESHRSRYTIVDNFEEENGKGFELKKNSYLSDKPD